MNDIYWISVVDNLSKVSLLGLVISGAPMFLSPLFASFILMLEFEEARAIKATLKIFKASLCIFIVSVLGFIFIPSKEQICAIYNTGGIIDCKKRMTPKPRLPDKAIKALDIWLDKQNEDKDNDD